MSHNIVVPGGTTVRLPTAGKYCDRDIIVTAEGGGLSLDVVTASSLPGAVVDGQIVVITGTTPGTVYIDTDAPGSPAAGDVWIELAAGGSAALELTEESPYLRNGLAKVKQYINGTWGKAKGYLGVSGAWVEIISSDPLPDFSYTGEYTTQENDDGWEISFLSSGRLNISEAKTVDVFIVGGGGGGGGGGYYNSAESCGGGGGGGGYTSTHTKVELVTTTGYEIVIGAGGAGGVINKNGYGTDGGVTSAFGYSVNGGKGGGNGYYPIAKGGDGGSGGGGGAYRTSSSMYGSGGDGGSDGVAGKAGILSNGNAGYAGGAGQGTTTRAFGDVKGIPYAGGGGAGITYNNANYKAGKGGEVGGGNGGGYVDGTWYSPAAGSANTGGGGGGGNISGGTALIGAAGGSGIVIIRNARG